MAKPLTRLVDDDADYGAHGRFDDRARDRSPQLWADTHRGVVTGAAIAVLALVVGVLARWRDQW